LPMAICQLKIHSFLPLRISTKLIKGKAREYPNQGFGS